MFGINLIYFEAARHNFLGNRPLPNFDGNLNLLIFGGATCYLQPVAIPASPSPSWWKVRSPRLRPESSVRTIWCFPKPSPLRYTTVLIYHAFSFTAICAIILLANPVVAHTYDQRSCANLPTGFRLAPTSGALKPQGRSGRISLDREGRPVGASTTRHLLRSATLHFAHAA